MRIRIHKLKYCIRFLSFLCLAIILASPAHALWRSVKVNGRRWTRFDPTKGDVEITGSTGKTHIDVRFA